MVNWDEFTPTFLAVYEGTACRGESPCHPLIPSKTLPMAYILNGSERAIEEQCMSCISVRLFVGLGIYDAVPDHSTLTLLKRRLQKHGGISDFKVVFDGVSKQALAKGVRFGSIQIVDSVHTVANVNNDKDRERHEQGKPSADPDATVVHKGKRVVSKASGVLELQDFMHLGYRSHLSQDPETGIGTSIKPATGSSADNEHMSDLLDNDTKLRVAADTYTADGAYDDGELDTKLRAKGKHSALMLRSLLTEKKDGNRAPWSDVLSDPLCQVGVNGRSRIEGTSGEAKHWHRLGLARYRSLANLGIQSYVTFTAMNLKRVGWLLTGVRLREVPACQHTASA